MTTNEDLTVVLTLWDRVPWTFRWLSYANQIKFPFRVLIADGGRDESVQQILGDSRNYPDVNYEYLRYPYDSTPAQYYTKVLDALDRVNTRFVVLADNDDFYLVDALLRSVDFLKTHPDFSSCRGIIGGFTIAPDPDYIGLSQVYGKNVSFVRHVYPDKSNLEETALRRVQNYFASYRANWYDVFRTEQTRASFQVLRDLNTQDLILSQHIPMLLGVIAGKVQIERYLYLLRQLETPNSCDHIETTQRADLFDRMLLETWSQDFKGFVNTIARAISQKDEIPVEDALMRVKESYRSFIAPPIVGCLWPQVQPVNPSRDTMRKIYRQVTNFISGDSKTRKYIPADKLTDDDQELKFVYKLITTPPTVPFESVKAKA